jgi:hypothetical protein
MSPKKGGTTYPLTLSVRVNVNRIYGTRLVRYIDFRYTNCVRKLTVSKTMDKTSVIIYAKLPKWSC